MHHIHGYDGLTIGDIIPKSIVQPYPLSAASSDMLSFYESLLEHSNNFSALWNKLYTDVNAKILWMP